MPNMKTKYLLWGSVAVIVVMGSWFGRAAWRAHRNLVTLHVRNAPLADVIRKLERQTWEKIEFDKKLDALITLDVKDKPLEAVLDRLAKQCGGSWRTVYAVYDSPRALPKLESALYGDKKLEEVGWKIIAPVFSSSPGGPDIEGGDGGFVTTNGSGSDLKLSAGGGPIII